MIRLPSHRAATVLTAALAPVSGAAGQAVPAPPPASAAVAITEGDHEGRPQFVVDAGGNTFYFDRAGGGLSRAIDRDGNDWISFKKDPLNSYPASAAAGYRGIPNLVFKGSDGGAGHPGHDKCQSELAGPGAIRTESLSGRWAWTWTFSPQTAYLEMERVDPEHPWWFLYEGTAGGGFDPASQFWGTDLGGPDRSVPDAKAQRFANWRWAYFGMDGCPRVLAVIQHGPDTVSDTMWYLGSSDGGAPTAPDGMIVFGFGREPGATPALKGRASAFSVAFIESTDHSEIAEAVGKLLAAKTE